MKSLLILLPLLAAGCGYEPPAQADRGAPTYEADLSGCKSTVASDVNKRNAKTGLAWFASPVRRWGQISEGVQTCMVSKGYGQVRWCTDDEIKSGNRSGAVVVTAAGLQCSDPPDAKRRRAG